MLRGFHLTKDASLELLLRRSEEAYDPIKIIAILSVITRELELIKHDIKNIKLIINNDVIRSTPVVANILTTNG
ncbi:hypothetical protein LDI01_08900 [Lentilactobacillus diolivorans]|uniref:Uncharacterized protein n=1 Tax=Lentilactobacillus diolivorans TaxID=179838 RepID=A0ABQ0XB79_9LACO|nr:hypothetical protein LDI01_08900 [Lentilactobacillus diolivorans]